MKMGKTFHTVLGQPTSKAVITDFHGMIQPIWSLIQWNHLHKPKRNQQHVLLDLKPKIAEWERFWMLKQGQTMW